jgi:hypothetical protein
MVVDKKNLSDGNKPKVMALSFNEQATRIQDAVARRAYEIFASRAPESGNAIGDWRQAEAAMVKPLCCGLMPFGDHLWVKSMPPHLNQAQSRFGSQPAISPFAASHVLPAWMPVRRGMERGAGRE